MRIARRISRILRKRRQVMVFGRENREELAERVGVQERVFTKPNVYKGSRSSLANAMLYGLPILPARWNSKWHIWTPPVTEARRAIADACDQVQSYIRPC
jgi:hypothetical protein